jgi:hypothetical protein
MVSLLITDYEKSNNSIPATSNLIIGLKDRHKNRFISQRKNRIYMLNQCDIKKYITIIIPSSLSDKIVKAIIIYKNNKNVYLMNYYTHY